MNAYATIAQIYGKVDPKDETAVQQFFEEKFPTLSPEKQQEIVDELFFKTTGLGSDPVDEQTLHREEVSEHPGDQLTTLQKRILVLIAKGQSNAQIAQQLEISKKNIQDTIIDTWEKLNPFIKDRLPYLEMTGNNLINSKERRTLLCRMTISHCISEYLKNPNEFRENLQQFNEPETSRSHRS